MLYLVVITTCSDDNRLIINHKASDVEMENDASNDVTNDVEDSSQPVSESQSQKRPLVFGSDSEDDSGEEKANTQPCKRPRLIDSDGSSDEDVPLAKNIQSGESLNLHKAKILFI